MGSPTADVHARVHQADWALTQFGQLARRSFAALERVDPPADTLVAWLAEQAGQAGQAGHFELEAAWRDVCAGKRQPEPVEALFASVRATPAWVDWGRIERARRLFERTGMFGGFVLSLRALIGGYVAPAGNNPWRSRGACVSRPRGGWPRRRAS